MTLIPRIYNLEGSAHAFCTLYEIRGTQSHPPHIRIFFNPQVFLSEFKHFLVLTWRIQIEFAPNNDSIIFNCWHRTRPSIRIRWYPDSF